MLSGVDHQGEVDAALLSRRITHSREMPSEWHRRAGRLSGQDQKTQTCGQLLRPRPHLHFSVVRLTVFSKSNSATVTHGTKTMMYADRGYWGAGWQATGCLSLAQSGLQRAKAPSLSCPHSHLMGTICCNTCRIARCSAVSQCSKVAFCSPFVLGVIAVFSAPPTPQERALGTPLSRGSAALC